jgi:hypothetical protein
MKRVAMTAVCVLALMGCRTKTPTPPPPEEPPPIKFDVGGGMDIPVPPVCDENGEPPGCLRPETKRPTKRSLAYASG